jgi:DNA repair exonuclease SbcCD ATPase subunit
MDNQIRKNAHRSKKRSRSGAQTACPVCHKKLRGQKGLKAHLASEHPNECVASGLKVVAEEVATEMGVL